MVLSLILYEVCFFSRRCQAHIQYMFSFASFHFVYRKEADDVIKFQMYILQYIAKHSKR